MNALWPLTFQRVHTVTLAHRPASADARVGRGRVGLGGLRAAGRYGELPGQLLQRLEFGPFHRSCADI